MSANPNIETLRELVKRDQEFFKAQSQRLEEIQQAAPEDLSNAVRNALQNWDKSVVKDCNHQLLLLEEIEQPTTEERQIMQELNKLIVLGDHIMERRNLVQSELHAKLAAMQAAKAQEEGVIEVPHSANTIQTPKNSAEGDVFGDSHVAGADASPSPESKPHRPENPEHVDVDHAADPPQADGATDGIDSKILYAMIRTTPDAPFSEVKKAAKKAITLLHPDRNLGDPAAASKFADLQAACEVFETEERRQEFDQTGRVKQIEDLDRRLKALVMHEE